MSLLPIVVALSLGFTVVAGVCLRARRNMTMEAACREACGVAAAAGRAMYQLCMDTLRDDDDLSSVDEVGEYAYRAAWRALWAYLDTMGRAWHFLGNAALAGGEEKAAYAFCVGGRYQEAEAVEADYNRTILAYLLGKLIGVK
ncbi:hypothetical protein C2845_PM13G01740 [Panicum miliaceum]|uniref:Pectinesterase inhibitor domain-containing protein n=1 Tax=Panicum miliaceum TaxID=4540 RepID=A0A3L6RM33_PANMI|nr:hypothetical protein C2845_PM13G01740 [Panicum miliaceum]